jgi:hypothetical protein
MDREIMVTVVIPAGEAATDDEAIDLIGERLKPWFWTAQLPMPVADDD